MAMANKAQVEGSGMRSGEIAMNVGASNPLAKTVPDPDELNSSMVPLYQLAA